MIKLFPMLLVVFMILHLNPSSITKITNETETSIDTIKTNEEFSYLEYWAPIGRMVSTAQYNAYAEYYGISKSGAWRDTVDQTLIFDNKGEFIGSTSRSGGYLYDWYYGEYIRDANIGNISDDSYNALVELWGISTNNTPYKDIIDTLLGVGDFDSFTGVQVANGGATMDYNQITNAYKINYVSIEP